ncbi:type IV secretion system protein [Bartonella choladocola]|uniref:Type IV secretion system protein n=1 Tax=Bartonella choladocola TaxID=2750995 RepID=A0A1U9MJB7_9HYPH|nr:type IV secretion system protein [Bartonella choladocola]AQT48015.1 Type IV secretion system protein [Bartonella choladocola]
MKHRNKIYIGMVVVLMTTATSGAFAQIATYDAAVHRETQQTTKQTADILKSNAEIQKQSEAILKAVSGTRTDAQSIANAALGGSFNFGQTPSFADALGGGDINWGQLNGDIQKTASNLINGLRLVKSLSGKNGMSKNSSTQAAYESAINLTTSLASIVTGSQSAVTERSKQFQNIGGQIGKTKDIKGSIDFNTQMQLQTAQTTNEAIGAITAISAAEQSKLMQSLAEDSGSAELLRYGR